MAFNGKLRTRDRLKAWGVIDYAICHLCSSISVDRIKFRWSYSQSVWSFIAKLYLFSGYPNSWTPLNIWLSRKLKGNFIHCKLGNLAVAGSVYFISRKRNNRIPKGPKAYLDLALGFWIKLDHYNLDLWRLSRLNFCFFRRWKIPLCIIMLSRADSQTPVPSYVKQHQKLEKTTSPKPRVLYSQ